MRAAPIVLVLTASFLAGCASIEQQAAQAQQDAQKMVRVYGPACQTLGYQPDTDQWRSCIMNLSARDYYYYTSPYWGPYSYGPYPYYWGY